MTEAPIKSLFLRLISSNGTLPSEASIELQQSSVCDSIGNSTIESQDSEDKCDKMNDRVTTKDTRVFNEGFHGFQGSASCNASTTTGFDDDDIIYMESGNLDNSTTSNSNYISRNSSSERKYHADMQRYRSIRQWKRLIQGLLLQIYFIKVIT